MRTIAFICSAMDERPARGTCQHDSPWDCHEEPATLALPNKFVVFPPTIQPYNMLLMLKEHQLRTLALFSLVQHSYNAHGIGAVRLWGTALNMRQGNERYRPTFLACALANRVMGGRLATRLLNGKRLHGSAFAARVTRPRECRPKMLRCGEFKSNLPYRFSTAPVFSSHAFGYRPVPTVGQHTIGSAPAIDIQMKIDATCITVSNSCGTASSDDSFGLPIIASRPDVGWLFGFHTRAIRCR